MDSTNIVWCFTFLPEFYRIDDPLLNSEGFELTISIILPIQGWGKSGILAYFGLKIGYFGHVFWNMDFKFVLPIIYIDVKEQTQLEVNWTEFYRFGPQKWPYLETQFLPKSLLLLHFPMNLSETFRIDVYMDFANDIGSGIWFKPPKRIWAQNKLKNVFFGFWAQNVLEA